MNSYQMGFLIFILLPPILSIALDKLSNRVNGVRWIEWSESIWKIYIVEFEFVVFLYVFYFLGKI